MNPYLYMVSTDGTVVDFPLYNFGYKYTGFLRYNPTGAKKVQNNEKAKYFTYITKGEIGLFGLESLAFSSTIYLVGGLFKAATLHRLGLTSLHVSSVSPSYLKPQLALLNRPFLAIGDNDHEGYSFARKYGGFVSPKDIDEMTDEDVLTMIKENQ